MFSVRWFYLKSCTFAFPWSQGDTGLWWVPGPTLDNPAYPSSLKSLCPCASHIRLMAQFLRALVASTLDSAFQWASAPFLVVPPKLFPTCAPSWNSLPSPAPSPIHSHWMTYFIEQIGGNITAPNFPYRSTHKVFHVCTDPASTLRGWTVLLLVKAASSVMQ